MTSYKAPLAEIDFLLNECFGLQGHANLPGFEEATPDTVDAILQEAAKLSEEVLAPLNGVGDTQGCVFESGNVSTPDGFGKAYQQLSQGGWMGLTAPTQYGGQGLPEVLGAVFNEFASSANMALAMYPGLTQGAANTLHRHGSDELKDMYLPKLITGEWTGTMNLTEPHCGTDLGLIKSKAEPAEDGTYRLTGSKIFISGGEHDLAENIVHLVLARIEGAPEGTKGISLFLVPKFLPDEKGAVGKRNHVTCGTIEHKMGINGNATCVMNYDGATGFLVGEANKGLRAMFTMMNEARLAVGVQGLAQAERAYQMAVAYAQERRQGRALSGAKEPEAPADPIIVHPDIRRMLMDVRSFTEAGRALILWTAMKASVALRSPDEADRQAGEDHMGLLTPVIKGVLTDGGFEACVTAQQVFGGAGYITETGIGQVVRDARIAMIYEGANGIQALDLVGRKLPRDGGRALMAFFAEVDGFLKDETETDGLGQIVSGLKSGRDDLEAATMWLMQNAMAKPDNAGAAANDYMHLFGLVALGFMWGKMAKVALGLSDAAKEGSGNGEETRQFTQAKLATAAYFMARKMPETKLRLARIESGADPVMALTAEMF